MGLSDAMAMWVPQEFMADAHYGGIPDADEIYGTADILRRMSAPAPETPWLIRTLRDAARAIPQGDAPPPQFPLDPRSISFSEMFRSGLDTTANWLARDPQASDMAAPLGAGAIAGLFRRAPLRTEKTHYKPKELFHMTPNRFHEFDISRHDVGVHAGTRQQALDRARAEGWVNPIMMEVDLRPGHGGPYKSVRVKDLDDWPPTGLRDELAGQGVHFNRRQMQAIDAGTPSEGYAAIREALKAHEIDVLRYRNKFQGLRPGQRGRLWGSDSYIALHPESLYDRRTGRKLYSHTGAPPGVRLLTGQEPVDATDEELPDPSDIYWPGKSRLAPVPILPLPLPSVMPPGGLY